VLDYYHCAQYLHKVAKAHYGASVQAVEWVEATLARLYRGKVGLVLGGLQRMQVQSDEAAKAIANCGVYLNEHRGRTAYCTLQRGGYPLGSGESNRPTNSFAMYGSSAPGPGGMRSIATRCWHCAVPNITAPSIKCLGAINSG
jgi:hypothetical protein